MIQDTLWLERKLAYFHPDLRRSIAREGVIQVIPANTEILREGQFVKVVPVVVRGLVKVFSRFEDRELLLYYIQPEESCIMSFAAALDNTPSRIFAVTEEESEILLLPSRLMNEWVRQYPSLNQLFYQQYYKRYEDLLQTVQALLFNSMDKRLLDYLHEKSRLKNSKTLTLRHREIANELSTAREVISRVMKRLENEGLVRQLPQGTIEIL